MNVNKQSMALPPAASQVRTQSIDEKIESLFVSAKEEVFEDGMESSFSRELVSMVREHGESAVQMIADLILQENANPEVASEALRWIGAIEHPATYHSRLSLLEQSLNCLSPWVRDGATLGLAYMEDPHAISYLKRAIDREPYKLLRRNMRQVLAELEENDS